MTRAENEKRRVFRDPTSLSVVVKGRENKDEFWKEVAETVNVSRLGVSFRIQRKCDVGRIISLIMKMPKNFRRYDLDKKLYRVWGLVQYCSPISSEISDGYQIGVAFVGKHPPESYLESPLKSYRVSGMDSDGFWSIGEAKTPFVSRAHHRFRRSLSVRLAILDPEGEEITVDEQARTKNISVGGAAVFSSLEVDTGDCVRLINDKFNFSSVCVVRNRQIRQGEQPMLHLEFSDSEFPILEMGIAPENDEDAEDLEDLEDVDTGKG